jgi:integrase
VARRPSLEPKRTTKDNAPFVVNLPPALSGTGRRERRYFDTRKEAAGFATQQRIRLENYGTASTLLPPGKIEEALAAFDRLTGTGTSLLTAVDHYLRWRETNSKSVSFAELFARFQTAKASRSAPYRAIIRQTPTRFSALADRIVCDIEPSEIEDALVGMTPSVRNAFLRILRAAFNFSVRKGWCTANPITRVEMESLKSRRETLTTAQVSALLSATVAMDFELLPYQLLCLFAGVRPKEVERLMWQNVNIVEKFIEVTEASSKTALRRIVDMEPVLVRWLTYFCRNGGATENDAPVVPQKRLRHRLRGIRVAAGIEKWPQDAPRRTYASCWLAVHDDVNKLNNLMGHTSPDMLWNHYNRAVSPNAAKAFWKIEPPKPRHRA